MSEKRSTPSYPTLQMCKQTLLHNLCILKYSFLSFSLCLFCLDLNLNKVIISILCLVETIYNYIKQMYNDWRTNLTEGFVIERDKITITSIVNF